MGKAARPMIPEMTRRGRPDPAFARTLKGARRGTKLRGSRRAPCFTFAFMAPRWLNACHFGLLAEGRLAVTCCVAPKMATLALTIMGREGGTSRGCMQYERHA